MTPTAEDLFTATAKLGSRIDLGLLVDVVTLHKPEHASLAWKIYTSFRKIDDADVHVLKLLPRVADRLFEIEPEHPELRRLLGIKRYLSVRSGMLAHALERVKRKFGQKEVAAVAIKGEAQRRLLGGSSSRPMMDADLVVSGEDFERARQVLFADGYLLKSSDAHAESFVKDLVEIDLHHHALPTDPRFNALEWVTLPEQADAIVPVDPTAHLIILCLHGMRTNGGALWLLDAAELIREKRVNWEVVMYYAETRALVLTLCAALTRVAGVPDYVLGQLLQTPVSHVEALELRHLTTPFDTYGRKAHKLLVELRSKGEIVPIDVLRKYEDQPGYRWDARWNKEWRT